MTISQQYANAISPTFNVIAIANAGSGKTTLLIRRIIGLLVNGVKPSTIVVITYTVASATDITERIEKIIYKLHNASDQDLLRELQNMGHIIDIKGTKMVRELCKNFIENSNSRMYINTIHAFCKKLLDDVNPEFKNYSIENNFIKTNIKQKVTQYITEDILREMVAKTDKRSKNIVSTFVRFVGKDIQGIEKLVSKIIDDRVNIASKIRSGDNESFLQPIISLAERDLEEELLQIVNQNTLRQLLLALAPERERNKTVQKHYTAIEKMLIISKLPVQQLQNTFLSKDKDTGGFKAAMYGLTKINYNAQNLFKDIAEEVLKFVSNSNTKVLVCSSLMVNIIYQNAVAKYKKEIEDAKMLDYSAILEYTFDLLNDIDTSRIYNTIYSINHLFVDEAQDVAPISWDIILCLAENMFEMDVGKTLFIVGDEKQSIFAFQGADVKNFTSVIAKIKALIKRFNLKLAEPQLITSYRCGQQMLTFVDNSINNGIGYVTLGTQQPVHHISGCNIESDTKGLNSIHVIHADIKSEVQERHKEGSLKWQIKTEPKGTDLQDIIYKTKGIITQLISSGTNAKDIIVLTRSRSSKGNVAMHLCNILNNEGINCQVDRVDIKNHILFYDFISLATFLIFPDDNLNLAALISGIFIEEDDINGQDAIARLENWCLSANQQSEPLINVVNGKVKGELTGILELFKNCGGNISIVLSNLLYNKGIIDKVFRKFGALGVSIMQALLEIINTSSFGYVNLTLFLKELGTTSKSIATPRENAVLITTPHSAKGLESRVVILLDLDGRPIDEISKKHLENFYVYKGQLCFVEDLPNVHPIFASVISDIKTNATGENARLFYVSITRAKERLYIIGNKITAKNLTWTQICNSTLKFITTQEVFLK